MNKYEQLIEYIINEQDSKARELFHQIVVEKSRDIYENLIDEEDFDESVGGNQVDRLAGDIQSDEQGMQEADDEDGMGGDDMGDESPAFDEFGDDGMGDGMDGMGDGMDGEGTPEERISDLETALDDLKAEFDALMAGEEEESEHGDMFGGEPEGDDEDAEVDFDMEEPTEEGFVREYVEKVGKDWPRGETEGTAVGARGDSTNVNKQSIVAKPNRMGGSSSNILKGGTEQTADGKPTPTPSNEYTKKRGELKGAGQYQNVPGAKTKGYTNKATSYEKAKGKEGETTSGKLPVNPKSLSGGKVR